MAALDHLAAPLRATPTYRSFLGDFVTFVGRRRAVGVGALLMLGAVLEGVGLIMLLPLLGVVLGDAGASGGLIEQASRRLLAFAPARSPMGQLGFLLILLAALMAVRAAVLLARDVALAKLQIGFVESHRLQIIRRLAGARWDVISRLRHGRITHVLGGDVQACGDAAQLVLQLTVAAVMLAAQSVLLVLLSPPLAVLILGLFAIGGLALVPVLRRARGIGAGVTESNLRLVTGTTQFLGGLKLAISQDLQRGFVAEFEQTVADVRARRIGFVRQRTTAQLVLTALAAALAGATLLLGLGPLTAAPATLIAFLFILARMTGPAAQIQAGTQHIAHSLPAYAKIKELEAELERSRARSPLTFTEARLAGPIEFRGVTFRHRVESVGEASAGGVFDLDLAIAAGAMVGIAGASGAGKTTFADLLVGLYPPDEGAVVVAQLPLAGEALARWRRSISYVSQDPFLFHDSIRRNLLWAQPDATESDLWDALAASGADALVRGLPGGLDAVVGERGSLVSGGERQRIALARALLRAPSLLVLDEATNAIDVASEALLLARLRARTPRPTIVMIAHRQSSLDACDRLIEFDRGRIVRDG